MNSNGFERPGLVATIALLVGLVLVLLGLGAIAATESAGEGGERAIAAGSQ